jgi:hypothetical protein
MSYNNTIQYQLDVQFDKVTLGREHLAYFIECLNPSLRPSGWSQLQVGDMLASLVESGSGNISIISLLTLPVEWYKINIGSTLTTL